MKLVIDDVEYGLIWGTRAFVLAEQRLNMPINEIMLSVGKEDVILTLSYCAIQNWLENKDESNVLPFSKTQYMNWFDLQDQQVATDILQSYMDSVYQGKTMSDRYNEINAILEAIESPEIASQPKKVKKK